MMKCKFYIEKTARGQCSNKECLLENCYFSDCFNECECFEPNGESAITARLIIDKDNPVDSRTLIIQNCDKIILKPKNLEVEFKIEKDNFDDFDFIEINGHRFKEV